MSTFAKSQIVKLALGAILVAVPAISSFSQADNAGGVAATIEVDVSVVNLFFNVKDKRGALIPQLSRDQFEILEDGKPQTIKYFSADSHEPLTLGILVDTSASQSTVLEEEKIVGAQFLKEVLRQGDLAFVVSFDVNVDLLQDFTDSATALQTALNAAEIHSGGTQVSFGGGPLPPSSISRGTLLYDAIYLGAKEKLAREVGRKAMILLTDGEDIGSQLTIHNAIEAAQKADSIVYVILIADRGFYGTAGYSGDRQMKHLCAETGGRMLVVGGGTDKLKEAFDQIADELRSQYSIGYTPTNAARDGSFRKVQVRVKNGLKVQARYGYYAPSGKRDSTY